jgi:hypothetical protein
LPEKKRDTETRPAPRVEASEPKVTSGKLLIFQVPAPAAIATFSPSGHGRTQHRPMKLYPPNRFVLPSDRN